MQNKIRQQKLVFLGILLLLLLSYPFITIVNKVALVAGFPALYFYIFSVWISAIFVLYLVTDKRKKRSADE